jgi:fatty-acid desaturase
MNSLYKMTRIQSKDSHADPSAGRVVWSPLKSIWISIMYLGAIIGGFITFSWSAFLLFIVTSAFTLCAGHSVGMHRRLIHNSFQCPQWLEYFLVYCGTLIGLAGPFSIIQMHELRDWAQRQPCCHDYFASRQNILRDWFWILHCDIRLDNPPTINYEPRIVDDKIYTFLERSRLLQQVPWAILLYFLGGWSWVVWGIFIRVSVCMTGHWLIGYFAHRSGHRDWHIEGAGVQGYNVKFCGLITMGECWHNNHHAFPDSAKLGLYLYHPDPGWWMIRLLERVGLAWEIQHPNNLLPSSHLRLLSTGQKMEHV